MDVPRLELDAARPTPLYRQIAEALRYRISSGGVAAGARLPALRDAARTWGVNLHTARRAYQELAAARLIEIRRPGGTFVAPHAGDAVRRGADAFAREVLREGRRRLGLDPPAVAALLQRAAAPEASPTVSVVECSRTLATALAAQVSRRLGVEARPVLVEALPRVPPGPVVATYFHFTDLRAHLPERLEDVHFVAIEPVLDRAAAITRTARRAGAPVTLCERDPLLAPAIAADVRRLLGGRVEVVVATPAQPSSLLARRPGPVVFSPQSWEMLRESDQAHPNAFLLEYRVPSQALEALAAALGR